MCEAATRYKQSWWTINEGYCLPFSLPYQSLLLDNTSRIYPCAYLVKCVLSRSLDEDCECQNLSECRDLLLTSCQRRHYLYPNLGPLLSPYLEMVYPREHNWINKKSKTLFFSGQIKCIGYQFNLNRTLGLNLKESGAGVYGYEYYLPENEFCIQQHDASSGYRNYSGIYYDENCWKKSKTFNNRSYAVSFQCRTRCISKYRVRDGIQDCVSNEEDSRMNNSCPQIQSHRLQCSASELSCLLAYTVGDRQYSCSNGRDEYDLKLNRKSLADTVCRSRKDPECTYLRNYIRASSYNHTNEEITVNNTTLDDHLQYSERTGYRLYCDSFFDTQSGLDELPEFCQMWTCPSDKYRCLSGQCISIDWLCDGMYKLLWSIVFR